jgi:hypothetical protein
VIYEAVTTKMYILHGVFVPDRMRRGSHVGGGGYVALRYLDQRSGSRIVFAHSRSRTKGNFLFLSHWVFGFQP